VAVDGNELSTNKKQDYIMHEGGPTVKDDLDDIKIDIPQVTGSPLVDGSDSARNFKFRELIKQQLQMDKSPDLSPVPT
jgi:hypothetical protein